MHHTQSVYELSDQKPCGCTGMLVFLKGDKRVDTDILKEGLEIRIECKACENF